MLSRIVRDEKGMFNATELLVSVAVLAAVFGGIFNLLYYGQQRWSNTSRDTDARQNGRLAMSKIIKEVREAQSPSEDDYGIYSADKLAFQFYADINSNPGPERIRYFLNGNQLVRGELDPSTTEAPWVYTGEEQTEVIAQYVRNDASSPIFRYLDENQAELTSLPLSLVDRKKTRLVEVSLLVDVSISELPDQMELESESQLRNLRE